MKQRPDWESVERQYRIGDLSLREIGRQFDVTHAAIRKHAAKEGWTRDSGARIGTNAKAGLVSTWLVSNKVSMGTARVRSEVRTESAQTERDIEPVSSEPVNSMVNAEMRRVERKTTEEMAIGATLDRRRSYGVISNDDEGRRFEQDGKYFDVVGKEISPKPAAVEQ
jgi:hypothetical protein